MPGAYGELFLRFFYDPDVIGTVNEFLTISGSVKIIGSHLNEQFKPTRPSRNDTRYLSCLKSWIGNFTAVHNQFREHMFLTPYSANQIHLNSLEIPPKRVLTFRPAQGQQSDHVLLDFVKPRFSTFLSNPLLVVAMSRFCVDMTITFVPMLNKKLVRLFNGYTFKFDRPIAENYGNFQHYFYLNHVPDPKSPIRSIDQNGNFFLKWWFFLSLVEAIVFKSGCLGYSYSFTNFGVLAKGDLPN
jgi:hypothetical protein